MIVVVLINFSHHEKRPLIVIMSKIIMMINNPKIKITNMIKVMMRKNMTK